MDSLTSLLDKNSQKVLLDNHDIFVEFLNFSTNFIDKLLNHNIITIEDEQNIKNADNNIAKVNIVIERLMSKTTKYFKKFLEVLIMSEYDYLVDFITSADTSQTSDIEEILIKFPKLEKALKPDEKKSLLEQIVYKIRYHQMKYSLNQTKQNVRKASVATKTQVEQSWKFQKEIHHKDMEALNLKTMISEIESELQTKMSELKSVKENLDKTRKEHEQQLEIANKFSLANDNELIRKDRDLIFYKETMIYYHQNILECLSKLPRSNSTQQIINKTQLNKIEQFNVELQIEYFIELFNHFIIKFKYLSNEVYQYDALKNEIDYIIKTIFNCSDTTKSLRTICIEFMDFINDKITNYQNRIKVNEDFIFGRLQNAEIPIEYKGLKVPYEERKEYEHLLIEMDEKIKILEMRLDVKENELIMMKKKTKKSLNDNNNNTYNNSHIMNNTIIEVIPEELDEKETMNTTQTSKKKTLPNIPFSYPSFHTSRTREPKFINPKYQNRNSLKTSVVQLL